LLFFVTDIFDNIVYSVIVLSGEMSSEPKMNSVCCP